MVSVRAQQGLTRLEFVIAATIIAVLVAVFLHRTELLQGRIEAHTVRADIDAMRTAVTLARVREGARPGSNPVALLSDESALGEGGAFSERGFRDRYAGAMDADGPDALPRGQWAYQPEEGWLVYRIRRPGQYRDGYLDDPPRVQVRIGGTADTPELVVEPSRN